MEGACDHGREQQICHWRTNIGRITPENYDLAVGATMREIAGTIRDYPAERPPVRLIPTPARESEPQQWADLDGRSGATAS